MKRLIVVLAVLVFGAGATAETPVEVVTTTEDLAALVREVGGDRVKVESIARGFQDPHFVEPKPSFILKLSRADMLVVIGRDLERGWLPGLIQQSRNAKIQPGARAYLDASLTARVLEMPTGPITRAMGDVHALGNPHYWLDPHNGRQIARAIAERLSELRQPDAAYFTTRYVDFDRRLGAAERRWDARMGQYRGTKIVTYHRAWSNFVERFGLDVVGYIEPKPGIPPSPSHTLELVRAMQAQQVGLIIVEPYFDLKLPAAIARQARARVLVLPPSVGGEPEVSDYIALFDYNLNLLGNAIEQARRDHHPAPHHHDEHR
jgi:ABC-type Zn uptake system ZnuABC Zn-binding protein ZnuA